MLKRKIHVNPQNTPKYTKYMSIHKIHVITQNTMSIRKIHVNA